MFSGAHVSASGLPSQVTRVAASHVALTHALSMDASEAASRLAGKAGWMVSLGTQKCVSASTALRASTGKATRSRGSPSSESSSSFCEAQMALACVLPPATLTSQWAVCRSAAAASRLATWVRGKVSHKAWVFFVEETTLPHCACGSREQEGRVTQELLATSMVLEG